MVSSTAKPLRIFRGRMVRLPPMRDSLTQVSAPTLFEPYPTVDTEVHGGNTELVGEKFLWLRRSESDSFV